MKESLLNEQNKGNNKLLDMEEKNDELEIKPENRDNRINTIKTVNSENENEQNLNINLTKKLSLKSQNSILSEFKDFQSSRNSSIASFQPKDRCRSNQQTLVFSSNAINHACLIEAKKLETAYPFSM